MTSQYTDAQLRSMTNMELKAELRKYIPDINMSQYKRKEDLIWAFLHPNDVVRTTSGAGRKPGSGRASATPSARSSKTTSIRSTAPTPLDIFIFQWSQVVPMIDSTINDVKFPMNILAQVQYTVNKTGEKKTAQFPLALDLPEKSSGKLPYDTVTAKTYEVNFDGYQIGAGKDLRLVLSQSAWEGEYGQGLVGKFYWSFTIGGSDRLIDGIAVLDVNLVFPAIDYSKIVKAPQQPETKSVAFQDTTSTRVAPEVYAGIVKTETAAPPPSSAVEIKGAATPALSLNDIKDGIGYLQALFTVGGRFLDDLGSFGNLIKEKPELLDAPEGRALKNNVRQGLANLKFLTAQPEPNELK